MVLRVQDQAPCRTRGPKEMLEMWTGGRTSRSPTKERKGDL